MATKTGLVALVIGSTYFFDTLKHHLNTYIHHPTTSGYLLLALISTLAVSAFASSLSVAITFAWNCFLRPLGKSSSQEGRLNSFYEGQASVCSLSNLCKFVEKQVLMTPVRDVVDI